MAQSFTIDVTQWQQVENTLAPGSKNVPTSNAAYSAIAGMGLFECSSYFSNAEKVVSAPGYVLRNGGAIKVKFTNVNTNVNPTLNINGTGAKIILYNGKPASNTNTWIKDETVLFYYDASYYSNAGAYIGRNIEDFEHKVIILKYWGHSNPGIQLLENGDYFFEDSNNRIGQRTSYSTYSFVPCSISKNNVYLYNNHFYISNDGESLVDITDLFFNSILVQSTGNNTKKVMSQKAITDNLNSINASVSRVVFGSNAEDSLNYSQHLGNKALTSDGNLVDITGIGTNVYIYPVQNLKTNILKIIASTRYSRPYYAFYSSDSISSSTLIEKSEEHSGSASTSKTFTNVEIPANATHLVINYILDSNQYTNGVFNLCPFILNNTYSSLYNKKWACIGDSLTAINNKTTRHYFDFVAEDTGIIPLNYGYSGSGYARLREENHAFYQRIGSIDQASDIITIFGSFNDLGALGDDFHLGDVNDTGTTSLSGCINTTIDNLYTIIPTARLGLIAPTPWATSQPGSNNSAKLYVELLEAISIRRSIPFLDLWRHSNLRPWDSSFAQLVYSEDPVASATHPNAIGHSIIAPMFREFVKSLL